MKILVIDDSQNHQLSARQTLGLEHSLSVARSHDEASEFLDDLYDEEKLSRLKAQYKSEGMSNWDAYCKAREESQLPYWDAVLCDLLMPAGKAAQGGPGMQYVGTEMPVGWSLAIKAALHGAKYVAVVTDMNHHHHPASAMLDCMNQTVFGLHSAKALFTNYVGMVGIVGEVCTSCHGTKRTEEPCGLCGGSTKWNGEECTSCDGTGKKKCYRCRDGLTPGKDWAGILQQLLKEDNAPSET